MECEFIPIDYDYFDFEGTNYIKLIGKSAKGKRICVVDNYDASFFVILTEDAKEKEIKKLISKIEKIEIVKDSRTSKVIKIERMNKHFLSKKVNCLEVFVTNHKDMPAVSSEIGESSIIKHRRGHDIKLITKYIMQGGLEPLSYYDISGDTLAEEDFGGLIQGHNIDLGIRLDKATKLEKRDFAPRVLSYDIESELGDIGSGEIYMIGLYGDNYKKVLTWKADSKKHDYVETFDSEKEMIQAFVSEVQAYEPDILCGYFSDGYDLPFLRERAKKYRVKLHLGLDNKAVSFKRGNIPTGRIGGVIHVDIYRFIASVFSQYLSGESLSLNDVAGELVGEMKDDFDFARLSDMKQGDWEDFFSYNLRDVEVTYKLFHKIWIDLYEFCRIIREPLFDISRNTVATDVEYYILHNLSDFDEIPERNPTPDQIGERRSKGKYEGAFVYEPQPGFYKDVVMFDFTSMYGSVIITYNLSKSTHTGGTEGNYTFSKKQGFFPKLMSDIIELRKKYKKEYAKKKDNMSKARSNAYKLILNAAYGYQAYFGARYHSREAASSTAKLAKDNILSAIDKIKDAGYEILYSDTDSIAFIRGDKSKKEVLSFLDKLNDGMPGIMELDLEGFYPHGIFVANRGGTGGAKKKYALIGEDNDLKIRGFEAVRRDWCPLARELQSEILQLVLEDKKEKAEAILKKVIKDIKARSVPVDKLMIKTQLRKPISEYVATGPHVVAAKKMEEKGMKITTGMLVRYYVGEGKSKKVGDRVKLPEEEGNYDVDYYLKNQILPAAEPIFEVLGINVTSILEGQTQKGLFEFG